MRVLVFSLAAVLVSTICLSTVFLLALQPTPVRAWTTVISVNGNSLTRLN
jgi:hypothetical protein